MIENIVIIVLDIKPDDIKSVKPYISLQGFVPILRQTRDSQNYLELLIMSCKTNIHIQIF